MIGILRYYLIMNKGKILLLAVLSFLYLLISYILIGFKSEQLLLVLLVNTLFFASDLTRRLVIGFSIFIVYWIIFDYMKAFPNYNYKEVSIEGLYLLEKKIFGITLDGIPYTLNEYLNSHASGIIDFLSGCFYITWIPVPLLFAAFLFHRSKREFIYFSTTFIVINTIGFVIYYAFPAAPPWYVQQHGFVFDPATRGYAARLLGFDAIVGLPVFELIYSKSSNVFAAMPSLHSAYPLLVVVYGIRNSLGWINVFFVVLTLGIWFAAVYSFHHYLLDVMAGITCAFCGIVLFFYVFLKMKSFRRFIDRWKALMEKNAQADFDLKY
jgi:hypothetical protein